MFLPKIMIPSFPDKKYGAVYADPPWTFRTWSPKGMDRSAERHYPCMSLADIKALPVQNIAADDCALFLWAIDPMLPQALEVMSAWGFTFKTVGFYWVKQNKSADGFSTGLGYWSRANPEQCLLGTRGSPKRLAKNVRRLVLSPRGSHSEKPHEVAQRIERLVSGPFIELFARNGRVGWDVWGNEAQLPRSTLAIHQLVSSAS